MEPEQQLLETSTDVNKTEPEQEAPKATTNLNDTLPDGWETAVSPVDGRVYYFNSLTGATSWAHPSVAPATAVAAPPDHNVQNILSLGTSSGIMQNRSGIMHTRSKELEKAIAKEFENDEEAIYTKMTDYHPRRPINSHRCYSVVAMLLFFPLGMIAVCKSFGTVSLWKQERYEAAHDKSQQALLFARISTIIGVLFWGYFAYCYYAGPGPYVLEIPANWWPDFLERKQTVDYNFQY